MMRFGLRSAGSMIALIGAAAAMPALAQHQEVYAPRTDVLVSAVANQGSQNAQSLTRIVNGVEQSGFTGNGGGRSGGGNVNESFAQAFNGGGNTQTPLYSEATGSASLTAGRLRATVGATGPNVFLTPQGLAQARLDDTLYFTNTTGGDLMVSFTYAFDGRLIDTNGDANPGGELGLMLSCDFFRCFNTSNQPIRFAGTGNVASSNMNYYFNEDTPSYFGENIFGGANANFVTGLGALNGVNGNVEGWITANLLIPTGQTSLGVRGHLNLSCSGGSQCDFGSTGQFSFGALPAGLTYGSASGVFLTANNAPPGAVPEPATWALMILGFGTVGYAMRRRPRVAMAV